jgi:hypothetical protein
MRNSDLVLTRPLPIRTSFRHLGYRTQFWLSPENIFAVQFSLKLKSSLTELPHSLIKWSYRPEQVSIKSALLGPVKLRHGPLSTEIDSK